MVRQIWIIVGLVWVIGWISGCDGGGDDPVVLSMKGRTWTLSQVEAEHDRIDPGMPWRELGEEDRRQFVEVLANKELLVQNARDLYDDQLGGRELLIYNRWADRQLLREFWKSQRTSIEVPEAVIDSICVALSEQRYLRTITCDHVEDAREIYDRWLAGEDFDALGEEYVAKNETVRTLNWGWMDRPKLFPEMGNLLWSLDTLGQVAVPFETPRFGYHVMRLDSIRTVDPQQQRPFAEMEANNTYKGERIREIMDSIAEKYSFEVITENLGPLRGRFAAMHDSLNADRQAGVELDLKALPPPIHRFTERERALPLVKWSGGVMTIGDFVETLWEVDLDYWPTVGNQEKIVSQIERRLQRWSFRREADAEKAAEHPELKAKMERKHDELLIDRYHREHLAIFGERVTDTDVAEYWQMRREDYRSRDLVGYGFMRFPLGARDLALRTYEQLKAGSAWVIAAQNARRSAPQVIFEPTLDPTDGPPYPDITEIALRYDVNVDGTPFITPPIEREEEWLILRIYFRSRPNTLEFEDARDFVRRDLQRQHMEDSLLATIDDLRQRYDLKLHLEAVRPRSQ